MRRSSTVSSLNSSQGVETPDGDSETSKWLGWIPEEVYETPGNSAGSESPTENQLDDDQGLQIIARETASSVEHKKDENMSSTNLYQFEEGDFMPEEDVSIKDVARKDNADKAPNPIVEGPKFSLLERGLRYLSSWF